MASSCKAVALFIMLLCLDPTMSEISEVVHTIHTGRIIPSSHSHDTISVPGGGAQQQAVLPPTVGLLDASTGVVNTSTGAVNDFNASSPPNSSSVPRGTSSAITPVVPHVSYSRPLTYDAQYKGKLTEGVFCIAGFITSVLCVLVCGALLIPLWETRDPKYNHALSDYLPFIFASLCLSFYIKSMFIDRSNPYRVCQGGPTRLNRLNEVRVANTITKNDPRFGERQPEQAQ